MRKTTIDSKLLSNPHVRSRNERKKKTDLFSLGLSFVLYMLEIFTFRKISIAKNRIKEKSTLEDLSLLVQNTNYKEISIAANQKVLLFSVTQG